MKLVFMGTPSFAVPSLARLVEDGHQVTAVVTAPPRKRGRGQKVSDTPVGAFARLQNLPLLQPADLNDPDFHAALGQAAPRIIVVVAFRILPESIFSIPSAGIFNLHASLLPRYRGAAPIPWAVMNGETETGVTTFLLAKKVDTGGILLQERTPIGPDETGGELQTRLASLGADVVSRTVNLLDRETPHTKHQDEAAVSYARKITKEDMRIDWSAPAKRVHDQIRAFAPEPGAWTDLNGRTLKVFRSRMTDSGSGQAPAPGTVIDVSEQSCVVACGEGAVSLMEVMLEGRRRLAIPEFLRGHAIERGTVLGAAVSLPGA